MTIEIAYLTNLQTAIGGGAANADRVCREFSRRDDVDVTAVHAAGTDAPENFWTDELDYDALYPRSLKDGIEAVDPDIVLVHAYNTDMIEWLSEYAEEDSRIYTFRIGVNTLEQWLSLYTHNDPDRVLTPIDGLGFFDAIFAPSYAAAERVKFHYGDDAPHLTVAPCVVEYERYSPTPLTDHDELRIVTASRVAANNYILAPLLAARRLQSEYDIKMEIIGGGDTPYRQTVGRVAHDMESVSVLGYLEADEVRAHLQWADAVCIPSITQQAVPTVAVEAMAAGSIVLSGDYHTTTEEDTIVRVPVDHVPSWYEALSDVADDREDATEWMREGLDAAMQYDVHRVVEEAYLPMLNLLVEEYG